MVSLVAVDLSRLTENGHPDIVEARQYLVKLINTWHLVLFQRRAEHPLEVLFVDAAPVPHPFTTRKINTQYWMELYLINETDAPAPQVHPVIDVSQFRNVGEP